MATFWDQVVSGLFVGGEMSGDGATLDMRPSPAGGWHYDPAAELAEQAVLAVMAVQHVGLAPSVGGGGIEVTGLAPSVGGGGVEITHGFGSQFDDVDPEIARAMERRAALVGALRREVS